MKFHFFHLMPYPSCRRISAKSIPRSGSISPSSLFDPASAHLMYNDFMDELEYAADARLRRDLRQRASPNGYGLMPSPNLIAAALARRTSDAAICVMGNSLALYNPPTRVAEEFAMID